MSAIAGVWGTLLLPIGDNDGIDFGALAEQIDRLVASGVHGIYSSGTAGELHAQSEAEFDRVSALLAEKARAARLPFQIGCSHMDAFLSLERARRARALAPTAIQVILPDWVPPSSDEQRAFLDRIARAADPVPLVLYNPPHAKSRPGLAELAALAAAVPGLAGFKLPGGDEAWHREMARTIGHLSVFVPGHALATGRMLGAAGSYSNIAALSPAASRRWWDQMTAEPEAALAVEARLQRFIGEHILPLRDRHHLSNPALDKLLAVIGGWTPMSLALRWPYAAAPADAAERLRQVARDLLPEFVV